MTLTLDPDLHVFPCTEPASTGSEVEPSEFKASGKDEHWRAIRCAYHQSLREYESLEARLVKVRSRCRDLRLQIAYELQKSVDRNSESRDEQEARALLEVAIINEPRF